jgi:hypothetical protein
MLNSPVEVLQTAGEKVQKIDHSWFSSSLVLYMNFKLDTPDQDAFVIEDFCTSSTILAQNHM